MDQSRRDLSSPTKWLGERKKVLVFDFEANGLLPSPRPTGEELLATRVHCLAIKELGGGPVTVYADSPDHHYESIERGLRRLSTADIIVGHNIIRYDLPLAKKFYGWEPRPNQTIHDTLVLSHLGYTNLYDKDIRVAWKRRDFPRSMTGLHGLRAWGYRIRMHKSQVNETEDYSVFNTEMANYCARDVEVNAAVYEVFLRWMNKMPKAVECEHEFFLALEEMQWAGWKLDTRAADRLINKLQEHKQELEAELQKVFPPLVVPPSRKQVIKLNDWWNPKQLKTKEKVYPFNPNSAGQVAYRLNQKYGWIPKNTTPTGKPKITDEVLESLPYKEANPLKLYRIVTKRLSSLLGKSGYLTLMQDDGRIHGRINHCGAITHRCTHSSPNQANATSLTNGRTGLPQPYGKDVRACFTVPDGYKLVGCDASGLEARMLAHHLYPYDGGEFADEILNGDIHTANQHAADLPSRELAKRFFYALLYGAGRRKMGTIVKPDEETWSEDKLSQVGGHLLDTYFRNKPHIKELINDLKSGYRPGQVLVGLDGRYAENRAKHQTLNTLLQMDGAIIMKWATVFIRRGVLSRGLLIGNTGDWCLVGHIHDEVQQQVREDIAEEMGELAVQSIRKAGEMLDVRCRLDAEYTVGASWAETH